uniref:Scaffold protein n=1 Tax=Promethearchaeum syntrophicum TaxID=2594042 RepID=A0A5B9D946_9ARCH|nr:scaffold protein [Candidatus Prometheoarchaeum syntrophicum]
MKSTNYSEKVLDHFKNPRNVGTLDGGDVASGRVGNPTCGDIMEMYIEVKDDIIKDIRFQTFGCGSAVATSSMTTEMVKGMSLDQALKVTRKDVANELDGLPPIKMHCSNLAADALHEAIRNYRAGNYNKEPTGIAEIKPQTNVIKGEIDYIGKGVSYQVKNYADYKDQRVLVLFKGDISIEIALELTKHTGRVILLTLEKEIKSDNDLRKKLLRSDVKLLYEAKLLEILGEGEVEKVKILDLDEEDKYDLFVDSVIIPEHLTIPSTTECSDDIPL